MLDRVFLATVKLPQLLAETSIKGVELKAFMAKISEFLKYLLCTRVDCLMRVIVHVFLLRLCNFAAQVCQFASELERVTPVVGLCLGQRHGRGRVSPDAVHICRLCINIIPYHTVIVY